MQYFVNVILPIPLKKLFTYQISEAEASFLQPGMRIAVPFGKSKVYTALVHDIHNTAPETYTAKEIHQILDETPIVTKLQLKHWSWIASYYMCTMGEVFRAAVPGSFLLESETIVMKNEMATPDENILKDDEWLVYEALQHQPVLKIHEIMDITGRKSVLPVLKKMVDAKLIYLKEEIYEKYKPKLIRYIKLDDRFRGDKALNQLLDTLQRAPKQKEALLAFFSISAATKKPVSLKSLEEYSKVSAAVIKSLIEKNILNEYYLQKDRVSQKGKNELLSKQLNPYQEEAFSQIQKTFKEKDTVLLHGVTSSGKTEIYIKLIEETIREGEQVLYLLPEIALTTQLIERLQARFGEKVCVYHSKYSLNERVEAWNNILESKPKAQIVLGARSSVFLPFAKLGLIIVDEEHENSFKQFDPAPRYHARDTAIVLSKFHKAKILLGSATPAVESYFNALQEKYGLVTISRRHGNILLPEMELVDIKEKHRRKLMKGHFSDRLLEEIKEALSEGEQVILFQNRRGYAPVVSCETCGHTVQCPNCDVSLTYHQYRNELRCHYCGYQMAQQQYCLACGSSELNTKGFGTEQIESELKVLFPDAKTGRMDSDTTKGKHGYEKIITAFEQREIDILVGTQMLTKGLDFKDVTLVGIMNADALLNYPDFRAYERSFQLIQQVAGRAGRSSKRGKVIVQTYNPYHQILQQASVNDFDGMIKDQLNDRRQYKYPPFCRLIKITFKHKDYNKLNEGTAWFAKSMRNNFGEAVLGPEFPPVSRIRNEYIKNILLKIPSEKQIKAAKDALGKIGKRFDAIPNYRNIRIIYNVDYY